MSTCLLEYQDDAELVAKCRAIIARLTKPEQVTVAALASRLHRMPSSVSRSLHRVSCPPFDHLRGKSGRILWLRPNAELLEFLTET